MEQLASEVPQVFKKECSSVYFTPYFNIAPSEKSAAKGKLIDCFRQRRREFAKSGLISTQRKFPTSRSSSTQSRVSWAELFCELEVAQTVNVEEALLWLKDNCDPWSTVDLYWYETAKTRLTNFSEMNLSIGQYFDEFKVLREQRGLDLVSVKNTYNVSLDRYLILVWCAT